MILFLQYIFIIIVENISLLFRKYKLYILSQILTSFKSKGDFHRSTNFVELYITVMSWIDHLKSQLVSKGVNQCALIGAGDGTIWADNNTKVCGSI